MFGGLYLMIAEKTMLKLQGCGAILQQCFHYVLQLMEIQHVRSVDKGMVWVGMHFKEIALCAEGFCRQRHGRHILAVAACTAISAAWTLHAVGAVHDDAVCPLAHERKIPKIYYEVVLAEGIASFCQPYFCSASFSHLLNREAHVLSTQELCLLNIDYTSRMCCRHEEVCLTAQEGRNL